MSTSPAPASPAHDSPQQPDQPQHDKQQEATRRLLAQLWERNLPALHSRLALFTAAAEAADTSTLTPQLREQAAGEAHKLAGSLGMFGYTRGTDIARELELLLEAPAAPTAAQLTALTTRLRAELFPSAS